MTQPHGFVFPAIILFVFIFSRNTFDLPFFGLRKAREHSTDFGSALPAKQRFQ
jgi:hypothetical protein